MAQKRHFWGQNVKKISFGAILGRFGRKQFVFYLFATGYFLSQNGSEMAQKHHFCGQNVKKISLGQTLGRFCRKQGH